MDEALFKGIKVKSKNATKNMRGHLKCATCGAEVTWVEIHKEYFNIKTHFFRLLPNKKHKINCKYNTVGQVLQIAKDSDQDLITSLNDKKFEFRLNIIFESLNYFSKIEYETPNDSLTNEPKKTKKYIPGKIKFLFINYEEIIGAAK